MLQSWWNIPIISIKNRSLIITHATVRSSRYQHRSLALHPRCLQHLPPSFLSTVHGRRASPDNEAQTAAHRKRSKDGLTQITSTALVEAFPAARDRLAIGCLVPPVPAAVIAGLIGLAVSASGGVLVSGALAVVRLVWWVRKGVNEREGVVQDIGRRG